MLNQLKKYYKLNINILKIPAGAGLTCWLFSKHCQGFVHGTKMKQIELVAPRVTSLSQQEGTEQSLANDYERKFIPTFSSCIVSERSLSSNFFCAKISQGIEGREVNSKVGSRPTPLHFFG